MVDVIVYFRKFLCQLRLVKRGNLVILVPTIFIFGDKSPTLKLGRSLVQMSLKIYFLFWNSGLLLSQNLGFEILIKRYHLRIIPISLVVLIYLNHHFFKISLEGSFQGPLHISVQCYSQVLNGCCISERGRLLCFLPMKVPLFKIRIRIFIVQAIFLIEIALSSILS